MGSGSWDIPCANFWTKKENIIKSKARGGGDHLTPSIIHLPLCICRCLCNLISCSIVLQRLTQAFCFLTLTLYSWDLLLLEWLLSLETLCNPKFFFLSQSLLSSQSHLTVVFAFCIKLISSPYTLSYSLKPLCFSVGMLWFTWLYVSTPSAGISLMEAL